LPSVPSLAGPLKVRNASLTRMRSTGRRLNLDCNRRNGSLATTVFTVSSVPSGILLQIPEETDEQMHYFLTKTSLLLCAALLGASCVVANAASEAPALEAFDRAFSNVRDYTCILRVHEAKGERTQDRVYQYFVMQPHYVKAQIIDGAGKGSGGVWVGGDQVSGHLGGILSGIHLKIGIHDPRAVSLRGVTIPDGLIQRVIDDYGTIPGKLTQSDGGKLDGVETDRLELKVGDPASNHDVSDQILYLSKQTHWPIRQIMYSGSQLVLDESISDLKTNVGLTQSDFPF
jgi:outer membrane lipoprotein-sorting protein